MQAEPSTFWNNKILQWENEKYFTKQRLLFNYDVNSSVKKRMELARSILKEIVRGQTVLELGCGSALLMEDILSFGAKKYIGVDVSSVAIKAANDRILNTEYESKIELVNKNITEYSPLKADICFSLGLFDWLSPHEISFLLKKTEATYYFHSFSEKKKFSFSQFFHRVYVYTKYGHKNHNYIPRYYTEREIVTSLENTTYFAPRVFRCPALSFGCIVYNLPQSMEALK